MKKTTAVILNLFQDLKTRSRNKFGMTASGVLLLLLTGCANKPVLVGGVFDVLHYGHIDFIKKAKAQGDYLIVALEPDIKVVKYKKRQPIHTQQQRAENLLALRAVDEVLLLPELHGFDDYNALVQSVRPAVIAVTRGDPQMQNKQKQANSVGAEVVVVVDRVDGFSSSEIIRKLQD